MDGASVSQMIFWG